MRGYDRPTCCVRFPSLNWRISGVTLISSKWFSSNHSNIIFVFNEYLRSSIVSGLNEQDPFSTHSLRAAGIQRAPSCLHRAERGPRRTQFHHGTNAYTLAASLGQYGLRIVFEFAYRCDVTTQNFLYHKRPRINA